MSAQRSDFFQTKLKPATWGSNNVAGNWRVTAKPLCCKHGAAHLARALTMPFSIDWMGSGRGWGGVGAFNKYDHWWQDCICW